MRSGVHRGGAVSTVERTGSWRATPTRNGVIFSGMVSSGVAMVNLTPMATPRRWRSGRIAKGLQGFTRTARHSSRQDRRPESLSRRCAKGCNPVIGATRATWGHVIRLVFKRARDVDNSVLVAPRGPIGKRMAVFYRLLGATWGQLGPRGGALFALFAPLDCSEASK